MAWINSCSLSPAVCHCASTCCLEAHVIDVLCPTAASADPPRAPGACAAADGRA
jgi:hypothetical protein